MSTASLVRIVDLLERLIDTRQSRLLREHAADIGLPLSTAHRLFNSIEEAGLVSRERRGAYLPGPRLLALAQRLDFHYAMAQLARPILRDLARTLRCTTHLGVLDASNMVTYLVKEAGAGPEVFSREGMQLEGYCSAVGKVLLSHLPSEALDSYLNDGAFVALTPHTKTEPAAIRTELEAVHAQDYALDVEEITEGLICAAVPVLGASGVCAAISASRHKWDFAAEPLEEALVHLRGAAATLGETLGAPRQSAPAASPAANSQNMGT